MADMNRARAIGESMAEQERSAATMEAVATHLASRYAVAPNGMKIIGTSERIIGRAEIIRGSFSRDEKGELQFDHEGYTQVFWDAQETERCPLTGESIFLDADGHAWRESQLRLVDANKEPAPGETPAQDAMPWSGRSIELDTRTRRTVVAALQYWRKGLENYGLGDIDPEGIAAGEDTEPLSTGEIEALVKCLTNY